MNQKRVEPKKEVQKYLLANQEMNLQHPLVQDTAHKLCVDCADNTEKARKIFYFVRDEITYNMYPKDTSHANYYASAVLENGEGWCLQKSMLAATLCRASGIPARIGFAEVINHNLGQKAFSAIGTNHFSPHTYAEVYLHDTWIPITPVFDAPLCKRLQVPTVEFDGIHPAMLSTTDLAGNPYMEYVSKSDQYAAIPWSYVFSEIKRVYKEKAQIWFSETFFKEIEK